VTKNETLRKAGDETLVIIGASETNADLFYATQFLVGDPITYLEVGGRKHLLASDLECGRAQKTADVDEVVAISSIEDGLRKAKKPAHAAAILHEVLQAKGVKAGEKIVVPGNLTLYDGERLRDAGYELELRKDPLFPERVRKTPGEIEAIASSQRAAEEAMGFVIDELKKAEIRGDMLYLAGEPLTVEWLRREAHKLLLELDHVATSTIIAPGDQGCDPHQRGYGHIPANQTIIIDIFPQSLETRYWGDMTRTVVRGKASGAVKQLYQDVLDTQQDALAKLRDGVDGGEIHTGVQEKFQSQGNATEERDGVKVGFLHGTGHGVGLDIHEQPRMGKTKSKIESTHVVTVEPGLYYPGTGAVRLEDTVVVTEDGFDNLTTFPMELEI